MFLFEASSPTCVSILYQYKLEQHVHRAGFFLLCFARSFLAMGFVWVVGEEGRRSKSGGGSSEECSLGTHQAGRGLRPGSGVP